MAAVPSDSAAENDRKLPSASKKPVHATTGSDLLQEQLGTAAFRIVEQEADWSG